MRENQWELGKVHTDSTDFMRAAGLAGLAGLPLPSCNRYQRRSWPFKSSNHPTDFFHRASNVSMKFKGRKVPKISIDHLTKGLEMLSQHVTT